MNKFKVLLFDLFFVLSSIVGVGFVTGKEIAHFFISGKSIIIATIVFFCVFVGLSLYILCIKHKHHITTLTNLNKLAFGKYYKIGNLLLIILFIVTNSAMLAGGDNIIKNYLGISLPIVSLFLSIITFFIVIGGVNRIKTITNWVMPILLLIIIINSCCNLGGDVSIKGSFVLDIIYPIIFCCENFINFISVLLNTKSKPKPLGFVSGTVLSIIILLSAFAIGNLGADMPMLTLSKNLGNVFFVIYLLSVIFAIFTTLEISTYQCLELVSKTRKDKYFNLALILLVSQIIAYLGFNFIVKYLYTAIGIMSAIYLIALIIKLIIINKKFK